jgi:flagellar protein FlgJ
MAIADATVYTDLAGLGSLKRQASSDKKAATAEVARQFEAMFVQQVLKEVRKAKLSDGIMDSSQSDFYQEMYDQQLALHLTKGGGLGLAQVLERQLGAIQPETTEAEQADNPNALPLLDQGAKAQPIQGAMQGLDDYWLSRQRTVKVSPKTGLPIQSPGAAGTGPSFGNRQDFVQRVLPHAQEAAAKLGVEPEVLVAQAALESGWGQRSIRHADGREAYNLFGIKAKGGWSGERAVVFTLEYEGGVAVRKREPFRAYNSYRESFMDYAEFISSNPRYAKALESANNPRQYYRELQKAGYATDPQYANKLTSMLATLSTPQASMQH